MAVTIMKLLSGSKSFQIALSVLLVLNRAFRLLLSAGYQSEQSCLPNWKCTPLFGFCTDNTRLFVHSFLGVTPSNLVMVMPTELQYHFSYILYLASPCSSSLQPGRHRFPRGLVWQHSKKQLADHTGLHEKHCQRFHYWTKQCQNWCCYFWK